MRTSFKYHIYRQFFIFSLLIVITLLGLVELIYDDLEQQIVALEMKNEQTHYLAIVGDVPKIWQTATTLSSFVPAHMENFSGLPRLFQGLPVPFSGGITSSDKEYWVEINRLPTGVLYVARDTTLIEQRETVFRFWLIAVGCIFVVISFVLALLSARRIGKPLSDLAQEIGRIDPQHRAMRIAEDYRDHELSSIARAFNIYLNAMESYVIREQTLIGMASHELRTPIAVVSGALDILDERGTISEKDKKTVRRIRDAANEMSANVEAVLTLAKKPSTVDCSTRIRLNDAIQSAVQERVSAYPEDQTRILIASSEIDHEISGDASLVRILLRNLIQNALEHTQSRVTLQQNEQGLLISDEGPGLPQNVRLQLGRRTPLPSWHTNESGLGLFIVTLVCERLGWRIDFDDQIETGTRLQFSFSN